MADTFTTYDGGEYSVLERPGGDGDPLVMRFRLIDGSPGPPPHLHPHCAETYEVEEGAIELLLDGEWRRLGEGESLTVPAGGRHTFRNRSGARASVRNVHDPHHDFETYIRTIAALTHEHQAMGPSSPIVAAKFALLLSRHSDLIKVTDMPLRAAVPALATVARLLRVSLPDPA